MATGKPSGRFVPTLTEVVRPGVPPATSVLDNERLVQQILRIVKPRIEQQLRVALQSLVDQHMRVAAPNLQRDIEAAVRAAVAQALEHESSQEV